MTFPAIPIAFTGVPLQRPNADLPQIAGPSGVAVQTFGALLAGLAPHPDQRAPLLDAATLGADPVPETTPPDPGDLAQSVGAAEVPAQTEDAETAYVFHGLDGPEWVETAAISAPDFSAAPVPVTLNLAVSVPPQPPLPEAGAQDAAAPENPQLGAISRPVAGGAPVVEMPGMPVPGAAPRSAGPSMPMPASLGVGGIGWAPLTPVSMPLDRAVAQAPGALVPMADADTTLPPPPPLAPAAGTSPHTAGQWPAGVVTPQPALLPAAVPSFAAEAQDLAQPAPGPMAPAPRMAAAPSVAPAVSPATVHSQAQSDHTDAAQILIAKSPDQANAQRPPAPVATAPADLARLPLHQAALPLAAPQYPAQHRPALPLMQVAPLNALESAPVLPPNVAQAVAPDAQSAAKAPQQGPTNAPATQPMAAPQLVSGHVAPAPAAELGQLPQQITPQPLMPALVPPPTPPHAAVPPPPAATPAVPGRQPIATQPLAPAQVAQVKAMPAPAAKQPLKQPSVSFPLPADGAAAAPPRMAELALPHAPTADAPRASAEAQAVIRQIVAHGPQAGQGDLEITLRPEELGRLRVVVHEHAGQTSLFVTADRPETLDLLRRHTDLLVQEFRNQGFGALNVSVGGGAPGRGFGQGQPSDGAAAADAASGPTVPVQPNPPARLANAGQGMDLRL